MAAPRVESRGSWEGTGVDPSNMLDIPNNVFDIPSNVLNILGDNYDVLNSHGLAVASGNGTAI